MVRSLIILVCLQIQVRTNRSEINKEIQLKYQEEPETVKHYLLDSLKYQYQKFQENLIGFAVKIDPILNSLSLLRLNLSR